MVNVRVREEQFADASRRSIERSRATLAAINQDAVWFIKQPIGIKRARKPAQDVIGIEHFFNAEVGKLRLWKAPFPRSGFRLPRLVRVRRVQASESSATRVHAPL